MYSHPASMTGGSQERSVSPLNAHRIAPVPTPPPVSVVIPIVPPWAASLDASSVPLAWSSRPVV